MNAIPTTPAEILATIRSQVVEATGIDDDWVFLTPAPELVGKLPPASTAFAAVVPEGVRFPESPQHRQICPADVQFQVCLFSRVAVDRAFDGRKLLIDPSRGLLILAHKVILKLAGSSLETPDGQHTRRPIQCLGIDALRWAEGSNLILAYAVVRFSAEILYNLEE
ncbi:MAG: hypothetical protein ACPL7K_00105 [Armatimonadota bacterium]|jgi:hypothetical protein